MSEGLVRHLASYAAYHRDRRNVATHIVGIPLIVLGVEILLSRPQFQIAGIALAPVDFAIVAACCFYFTLDRAFACAMAAVLAAGAVIGGKLAEQDAAVWLGWGIGLFATGWLFQFLGHAWEGRKPAFLDDLRGLVIGPLYVLAEVVFRSGRRLDLRGQIERRLAQSRD